MAGERQRTRVMALAATMRSGGAERVVSLLLQHLDRDRFAPELAIVFDREIAYAIPEDVPVFVLERAVPPEGAEFAIELPSELESRFADSAQWLSRMANTLAMIVRRRRPDVVIASPTWASLLAVIAREAFPGTTRLISRVDSPPSVSLADSRLADLFRHFMRERFTRSDHVIAVSGEVRRELVEDFGIAPGRVEVVHNPVDIARVAEMGSEPVDDPWFAEDVPVVVFVGRLEPVKCVDSLLRALAHVRGTRPVRGLLVGDGSHRGYLGALAKHLGIDAHVRFAGRQANPFKFVKSATVFVLPSTSEGFSNVLVEAMACGCPVIATDIAGGTNRELLDDGGCGVIVPRDDSAALAAAIQRLLGDAPLRRELSARARQRVQAYDLPHVMRRYETIIDTVVRSAPVYASRGAAVAGEPEASPESAAAGQVVPASADPAARREMPRARGTTGAWTRMPRPRDASTRTRLAFLVPSTDDAFIGKGTNVYLRRIDHATFDVALIKINNCPSDRHVPEDVIQYSVQPRFGAPGVAAAYVPAATRERHSQELTWMAAVAHGLTDLLEHHQFDAVVAQGFYACIVATMAADRMPSPPLTLANMHSRAGDFANTAYGGDLYAALMSAYLGVAAYVLAPTESIRRDLIDVFGVAEEAAVLLPDPFDVVVDVAYRTRPNAGHPWFEQEGGLVFATSVGETASGGLPDIVHAIGLARRYEPVRLLIAGDGDRRPEIEALVGALDLSAAVQVADREVDLRTLLPHCRGFVHVGRDRDTRIPEGVIGAIQHGVPVIAIGGGTGIQDLLAHHRGLLVRAGKPQAVADAMLQILWDGEAAQTMARRASDHLESLSGPVVASRLAGLVMACLTSSPTPSSRPPTHPP